MLYLSLSCSSSAKIQFEYQRADLFGDWTLQAKMLKYNHQPRVVGM